MTDDTEALIRRFAQGGELIQQAISGVEDLDFSVPGEWSAREILAHMADAEVVRAVRIRLILGEDEPLLPVFDENGWRERMAYGNADATAALETYRSIVESTADLLGRCADEFDRTGIHPAEGPLSIRTLVERGCDHARDHVQQLLTLGW